MPVYVGIAIFALLIAWGRVAGHASAWDPILWIALAAGAVALWLIARAWVDYRAVRAAGWAISPLRYAITHHEYARFLRGSIPAREDWAVRPSFDEHGDEVDNLARALRFARGWDHETEERHRREVVYFSMHPEMVSLVGDLLREQGIPVELDSGASAGVFGVRYERRVIVRGDRAEEARAFVREYLARHDVDGGPDTAGQQDSVPPTTPTTGGPAGKNSTGNTPSP